MASEPKSSRNIKARNKIICISLITILIAVFISIIIWYLSNRNRINNGVFVDDVDISRLSIAQVKDIMEDRSLEARKNFSMTIQCNEEQWTYNNDDIGVDIDVERAISEAHAKGREGSVFMQLVRAAGLGDEYRKDIATEIIYDKDKLRAQLYKIKKAVDKQPVDATINFMPDKDEKFIITSGSTGTLFNVEEVVNIVDKEFENNKLTINIHYEPEIIKPKIDTEFYGNKTEKLSSFNTDLGNSTENRIHNVKLSAQAFNGMIIKSGQTISFNETVGDTTVERGYKPAPVIQPDKSLKDSPGGGVCQTASTLYNAVLLSNLEVVQSSRHSYPTSYVSKGLDATIYMSTPYIDLKFKNTKDYPIYICSYFKDNKIFFDIYGEPLEADKWIKLRTEEYETIAAPEPEYIDDVEGTYVEYEGDEYEKVRPRDGYKVRVYREIYQGDKMIQSDMLYDHYYRPVRGIIYTGIKTGRFIPDDELNGQLEDNSDTYGDSTEEATVFIRLTDG